tara:strand:+ start:1166 stop:1360 length:195 start_codon:yes stop_codon:yes gene_type:complete
MWVVVIMSFMAIDTGGRYMLMVTDLRRANIAFVPNNLFSVFTQQTVHGVRTTQSFFNAIHKTIQ